MWSVNEVVPAAERLLAERFGEPVALVAEGEGRRPNAGPFRCGRGRVFLKRPPPRAAESWDPTDLTPGSPAHRLRQEHTALVALAGGPVPQVLGVDFDAGVLVLEAVRGTNVDEIVLGDDPSLTRQVLLDVARSLGDVHRLARQRPHDVQAIGVRPPDAQRDALRQVALEHELRPLAVEQCEEALAIAEEPGPWHSLVHSDPCPDNVIWTEDRGAVLVDFEGARRGLATLDATTLRMAQPTCWCAHTAPELVPEAERRYREAAGLDVDDPAWTRAVAAASVLHLLGTLAFHLDQASSEDVT